MALFLIQCTDKPASTALRAGTRDAHLAYLRGLGAQARLAGPMLDEASGDPVGSLLIFEASDIAAARALAAGDPYAQAGLFAEVRVIPWRRVVGDFAPG